MNKPSKFVLLLQWHSVSEKMAKLKPPDRRSPTFFGMHYSGFFKYFSIMNLVLHSNFYTLRQQYIFLNI